MITENEILKLSQELRAMHREFAYATLETPLVQLSTVKGERGGLCNRTACQKPPAYWFNSSTRAYYCNDCAQLINKANFVDCVNHNEPPFLCISKLSEEIEK